jgi:hypothetical protein
LGHTTYCIDQFQLVSRMQEDITGVPWLSRRLITLEATYPVIKARKKRIMASSSRRNVTPHTQKYKPLTGSSCHHVREPVIKSKVTKKLTYLNSQSESEGNTKRNWRWYLEWNLLSGCVFQTRSIHISSSQRKIHFYCASRFLRGKSTSGIPLPPCTAPSRLNHTQGTSSPILAVETHDTPFPTANKVSPPPDNSQQTTESPRGDIRITDDTEPTSEAQEVVSQEVLGCRHG